MSFDKDYHEHNNSSGTLVTHDRPEYGARTSIAQLPALPYDVSVNTVGNDSQDLTEESSVYQNNNTSFVEFDLSKRGGEAKVRDSIDTKELLKDMEEPKVEVQETKEEKIQRQENDFFNDDKATWKTMNTIAEMDYYDERGNLEFTNYSNDDYFDPKNKNSGYTRIDDAEQVAKFSEFDKKTDFLFISKTEVDAKNAKYRDDEDSDDENYLYEDENLESGEALQSTKDMLDESQKFSYCGIVKLISVEMATELAYIRQSTTNKVSKHLSAAQKNFGNWSQYIIDKVYTHMDLNKDEQKMIDNLSVHGLNVQDLTSGLIKIKVDDKEGSSLEWILICDLFLLLLSDGYYDSRSRSLLIRFGKYLQIDPLEIYQFERRLLNSLDVETKDKSLEDKEELLNNKEYIDKYISKNKNKRLAYIGLATLGGTLAIGLSAGLLAPVIGAGLAAGLTTIGIGGTGGFLAGVGGTTIITTGGVILGAKAGNKAGRRRAGEVETFEFKPLHNNKRANLIITVSGWMTGKADDVRLPFSTVDPVMGDLFSVLWEPEMLTSMGQTIGILASEALTSSIQQILGATIASSLMAAIQIPVLLSKLTYLVDNPWNVSLDRAWKAGKILAENLISGNMGVRPITLVGFSLGARVVYSCLIDLAERGCFGLVENVILLGSPVTVNKDQLGLARSVVSNDFINGFSRKDWVLGYLFRATSGGLSSVAGLSEIKDCYGIKNFDVTEMVQGHMSYRKAIPKIMKELDWEVLNQEFDEIEEPDAEQTQRERKLIIEFDEARAKMKKELDEDKKPKKTWKNMFKPKGNNWWKEMPENEKKEEEEYDAGPIFDVDGLRNEVEEIEKNEVKADREAEVPINR